VSLDQNFSVEQVAPDPHIAVVGATPRAVLKRAALLIAPLDAAASPESFHSPSTRSRCGCGMVTQLLKIQQFQNAQRHESAPDQQALI